MLHHQLDVTAIINDEVTAVEVQGPTLEGWDFDNLKATGWSKKHPKDDPDAEVAFNIAMSRALYALASLYAQQAADIGGFPVTVEALDGEDSVILATFSAPDFPTPFDNEDAEQLGF